MAFEKMQDDKEGGNSYGKPGKQIGDTENSIKNRGSSKAAERYGPEIGVGGVVHRKLN